MNNLIGLVGPMQAGKDLAFSIMQKRLLEIERLALADKLKDACSAIYRIMRRAFDLQLAKMTPLDLPIVITTRSIVKLSEIYGYWLQDYIDLEYTQAGRLIYTPRELLQVVGTDILRAAHPDIHLDVADICRDKTKTAVITDCRFPNEVDWVKHHGGMVIYIERPEAELRAFESTHPSENGIPGLRFKCDYILQNRGTIEDFEININALLDVRGGDFK